MEIRCPKCKYKFEEEIAPGILEKACVCPRCGTPFIYNVENEDDKNGYDEINSNVDNLYSQNTTTSNDHGKNCTQANITAEAQKPNVQAAPQAFKTDMPTCACTSAARPSSTRSQTISL